MYLLGDSRALRNLTSSLTAYNGLAENVKVKQGVWTESSGSNPNIFGAIDRNHDLSEQVKISNGKFSFCVGRNKKSKMSSDEMSLSVSDSINADRASLATFPTRRSGPLFRA